MASRLRGVALFVAFVGLGCGGEEPARRVAGSASDGLVFARAGSGGTDLYRARIGDGAVRPFLTTPDRVETWPYWAESTGRLIFQVETERGRSADLWLWQPSLPEPVPLAARPERDERWAEWSPDGARVVFAFRAGGGPSSGIAWVDVADRSEQVVASSGPRDPFFRPSFDPGGRLVVAERRVAEGRGSTIWLIDERGPRPLLPGSHGPDRKPFFTRAGDAVVFAREQDGGRRHLLRSDLAGTVTPLAAGRPDADEHSARPSPVRDEFAFVSDRSGNRDVWLAPLGGGEARNLTSTPDRDEFAPRWSPDGELLVVTAAPPGPPGVDGERIRWDDTRLVVLDREGRVRFETPGMMADWMPPF
jgi:dipeptidyl aminopeptidase/acylaminoacyl peptidase